VSLTSLLSGTLCVIVRHLHFEWTGVDAELVALPLPELAGEAGGESRLRLSSEVVEDMVSCMRAALFFAVSDLKVRGGCWGGGCRHCLRVAGGGGTGALVLPAWDSCGSGCGCGRAPRCTCEVASAIE
jgi:hypothetical protein